MFRIEKVRVMVFEGGSVVSMRWIGYWDVGSSPFEM